MSADSNKKARLLFCKFWCFKFSFLYQLKYWSVMDWKLKHTHRQKHQGWF